MNLVGDLKGTQCSSASSHSNARDVSIADIWIVDSRCMWKKNRLSVSQSPFKASSLDGMHAIFYKKWLYITANNICLMNFFKR